MSTTWALGISIVLLLANAFFVAAEFALVAAKRHKLEDAAERGSRSSRLVLASTRQLSMMLAGAQLGITACTVGLGALAEPALAHMLDPAFHSLGIPEGASHSVAFLVALVIVVFLHMVVGEMMPKSWSITHPESSAVLLIWPFRGFTEAMRPILWLLNQAANASIRLLGVQPQDELAQAHGPDDLGYLLRESREQGLLAEREHQMLSGALRVHSTLVGEIMVPLADMVAVHVTASAADIEATSRHSGRSRLVVLDETDRAVGLVHVRDAVTADPDTSAAALMRAPLLLPAGQTVSTVVSVMRRRRAQLALVTDPEHRVVGLVAMEDLLEEILGEFEDETDR